MKKKQIVLQLTDRQISDLIEILISTHLVSMEQIAVSIRVQAGRKL